MKNETKKICLISPSLQLGGLERAMSNLAIYFHEQGYIVTYILHYKFERFYHLPSEIEIIEPTFFKNKTIKPVYYWKLLFYIRNAVKQCKPNAILSFGDYHNAWVLLALTNLNYPVFISDRSSPGKKFGYWYSIFKKRMYQNSTGVIAQTVRAANQKKMMLGEDFNIKVIPNAIRKMNIIDCKREKIVLAVGRHYHVKGLDRLIKAFAKITDRSWTLHVAGSDGPESEGLKSLVKDLGIETSVKFLGKVTNMDALYSRSGIFVLPSRSEGLPNALCEAMANGLACVSFDINAGPSDLITHNLNGVLVPDGQIDQLAKEIESLMQNDQKRTLLGANAKNKREELSPNLIGKKYLQFLCEQHK